MCHIAMISVHTCPLARPGANSAGGMNVYVKGLSQELGRNGMNVDIFTRWSNPELPRIVHVDERVRVVHLKAGPVRPVSKDRLLGYLPEFVCSLRHFRQEEGVQYRLMHSHYWLSGWVAGMLRHRWNIPSLVMFHTLGALKNKARRAERESWRRIETERRIISTADSIIASSDDEKLQMIQLYGANSDNVRVIPCGIDLNEFKPIDKGLARNKLGLDDRKLLLFVGRIEPLKAIDVLIRAVSKLPSGSPDFHLLVVGGDPNVGAEMKRLRSLAAQLGISNQVSFAGSVDHSELAVYYSAADLCIVPSHYESFSLVAAESLACGTPVVAARVGGLQSVVLHLRNGLLTPPHSPDALAQAISILIKDDSLRLGLATMTRKSVQHLGWPAIAKRILDTYDGLALADVPAPACMCDRN